MSELTVHHYTVKIPVQMPASTQADGDPGYTAGDAMAALLEQHERKLRAMDRSFVNWARSL